MGHTHVTGVCCNVLQCVAVCYSVLQSWAFEEIFAMGHTYVTGVCSRVSQSVAECCSVLQCVAVCCSVLQCVAMCCSVVQCVPRRKVGVPQHCAVPLYTSGHGCSVSRRRHISI